MDTITHALFGGLSAKIISPHQTKTGDSCRNKDTLIITAVAAAFPDIDYLSFWINPLIFISEWHRSITHSLFMAPIWGIFLTGIILVVVPRLRDSAKLVLCYSIVGIVSHILLDILTVYGTEIFYPFSDRLISLATTFVIDPYLTFIIVITLLISLNMHSRSVAITGIALVLVYVIFQWQLKQDAIQIATNSGASQTVTNSDIVALPQPLSPLHWRVIVRSKNEYSTALLDISGISEKLETEHKGNHWLGVISAYKSPTDLHWEHYSLYGADVDQYPLANEVWWHDDFGLFRQFAVFPILYRVDEMGQGTCVWFTDLRFHISTMLPSFRYGMCRNNRNNSWQLHRLRRFTKNTRQRINPG
jgi:inner membrane protein